MIRCTNCGTNNIDGSEYCDECGTRLEGASRAARADVQGEPPAYQPPTASSVDNLPSDTSDGVLPSPPSFTTSTSIPRPAIPAGERRRQGRSSEENAAESRSRDENRSDSTDDDAKSSARGQTFVLSSRGRTDGLKSETTQPDAIRASARLVIERGGRIGREFSITGKETNIGRWDADSGIFPDVDLDEDDPEAKISRRHARIVSQNGQYFIEDLGSTNGTFINRGRRLLPGKRHLLQNGDEIIVGKTFLKFFILR